MDNSLTALTEALKKIISQLKPHQHALSFVLLLGKTGEGKTAVLRQSSLKHVTVNEERSSDIYYNAQGIILELNESWLNQRTSLLQHTLKELNRCHALVKISGLILCVDTNALCGLDAIQMAENVQSHAQLLQRFGQALGHRIDTALMFTKLDGLAGFSDFFQQEHTVELSKPLGFSLDWGMLNQKLANNFKTRFEQLLQSLEQQVIQKMHPARSGLKRTLIREFPLQLACLRHMIQHLILSISPTQCRVQSIYFTSAEQGGVSVDYLNKKIQYEYALVVPDRFSQSTNYRAYFIEGALLEFQKQTQRLVRRTSRTQQWQIGVLSCFLGLLIGSMIHYYVHSRQTFDDVSRELLAYDAGLQQGQQEKSLYHLSRASSLLNSLPAIASSHAITELKSKLKNMTANQLTQGFSPILLSTVENVLSSPQETPAARYQALKIYLMLNEPQKRVDSEILTWFSQQWQHQGSSEQRQHLEALLKQILQAPAQHPDIDQKIVRDVRNYLNALPMSYLYYSLAKSKFSEQRDELQFEGFLLPEHHVPFYFTKNGFHDVMKQLPNIVEQLLSENWVLMRQDLASLTTQLQEAYCYDYVLWWQHFMQKIRLNPVENYQQASRLAQALIEANSIHRLVTLIQAQTAPDFQKQNSVFNRLIASQFTAISLVSPSALRDLGRNIKELQPLLMTLAVVHDEGRSAFHFSKTRFQGESNNNPLTLLYRQAKQFPMPIATWINQLADDTWFLVMRDTKQLINQEWQKTVFQFYQHAIAHHYPFSPGQTQEVSIADFDHFFSRHGVLQSFVDEYLKPFLDISAAEWRPKDIDNYRLPISNELMTQLIRANVITAMFFSRDYDTSEIKFSLEKINLDPIVAKFKLSIGQEMLSDTQHTHSLTRFRWPESGVRLSLLSIDGQEYELDEVGPWAFFKMLQKINVLVDQQDSSSLQILFEINGNSGRYLLKTEHPLNPFTPGILNGFTLTDSLLAMS